MLFNDACLPLIKLLRLVNEFQRLLARSPLLSAVAAKAIGLPALAKVCPAVANVVDTV